MVFQLEPELMSAPVNCHAHNFLLFFFIFNSFETLRNSPYGFTIFIVGPMDKFNSFKSLYCKISMNGLRLFFPYQMGNLMLFITINFHTFSIFCDLTLDILFVKVEVFQQHISS